MDILLKLTLLTVTVYFVNALQFKDCGSIAKVTAVAIAGCETVNVCPLIKGTNASIKINFDSGKETTENLTVKIYGLIAGVPIPFKPPNTDGCKGAGIKCPVKNSTNYSYNAAIPVLKLYPKVTVIVKYELLDQNQKPLFCILVPCKITDKGGRDMRH